MSQRLGTYLSIACVGLFDAVLGTAIGKGTEYLFPTPNPTDSLLKNASLAVGEIVFILFSSYELRSMLMTDRRGFFDPTGGMMFMLALFMSIHDLKTRIEYVIDDIYRDLFMPNVYPNGGSPVNQLASDSQPASQTPGLPKPNVVSEQSSDAKQAFFEKNNIKTYATHAMTAEKKFVASGRDK